MTVLMQISCNFLEKFLTTGILSAYSNFYKCSMQQLTIPKFKVIIIPNKCLSAQCKFYEFLEDRRRLFIIVCLNA